MDFSKVAVMIDMSAVYHSGQKELYQALTEDMANLMAIKLAVGHLNFQCDHDTEGICFAERMEITNGKQIKTDKSCMCCCEVCPATVGFMTKAPAVIFKSDLPTYDANWRDDVGFWRPGGCSLPVELRSPVCLYYNCLHLIRNDEGRKLREDMPNIRDAMDRLSRRLIQTVNPTKG